MALEASDLFVAEEAEQAAPGARPCVVFLHGTPSAPEDFAPLVARAARSHRVLVPHLPGYGRTPASGASPPTRDNLVAALERSLLQRGVTRAAFVAFSGGCSKAVAIALAGRMQVTKLILLAPALGFEPEIAGALRAMADAFLAGAFDPGLGWLDRMTAPGFAERDPAGAAQVRRWLDDVPRDRLGAELLAAATDADLRARVSALECPVLVCAGSLDVAVPPEAGVAVTEAARAGRFECIAGAGHAAFVEKPEQVTGIVGAFLDQAG